MASSSAHPQLGGGTSCFSRPTRRFRIGSNTRKPRTVPGPSSSTGVFTCVLKILHWTVVVIARFPRWMNSSPHGLQDLQRDRPGRRARGQKRIEDLDSILDADS